MAALLVIVTALQVWWSVWMARPSIAFAFAINWALMLVWYILGLLVPLRLPPAFARVRAFEEPLYARLGVRGFQRLLRATKFHGARIFPAYTTGPNAAQTLSDTTLGPEAAHACVFVALVIVALDLGLRRGWWDTAIELTAFNVVLNVYPALSMRLVRARAARVRPSTASSSPSGT